MACKGKDKNRVALKKATAKEIKQVLSGVQPDKPEDTINADERESGIDQILQGYLNEKK